MKVGRIVKITRWGEHGDVLWWAVLVAEKPPSNVSTYPGAIGFYAKMVLAQEGKRPPSQSQLSIYYPHEKGPGRDGWPFYTFPPDEEVPDEVWTILATRSLTGEQG